MPTADEIFPKCSKVKPFLRKDTSASAVVHFSEKRKIHFTENVHFIVPDDLWLVKWVAKGF